MSETFESVTMNLPSYEEFRAANIEQKKELLRIVKLRRIQHRKQDHNDETLTAFHDCVTCGVFSSRIRNFEDELYA